MCLASTRARSLWLSGDRQPTSLTGKELLPPEKPVRATRAGHRHGWQVGVTVPRPPCYDANAKCLSFKCYVHTPRTAVLLPEVTQDTSRLTPRGASLRESPAGPAHAPTGQIAAGAEKCAPHCAAGNADADDPRLRDRAQAVQGDGDVPQRAYGTERTAARFYQN